MATGKTDLSSKAVLDNPIYNCTRVYQWTFHLLLTSIILSSSVKSIFLLPVTSSTNVDRTGGIFLGRCEAAIFLRVYAVGLDGTEAGARSCTLLLYIRTHYFRYNILRRRVSFSTRLVAGFFRGTCRQLLGRPFLDRNFLVIRWRNLMGIAHPLRQMIVSR